MAFSSDASPISEQGRVDQRYGGQLLYRDVPGQLSVEARAARATIQARESNFAFKDKLSKNFAAIIVEYEENGQTKYSPPFTGFSNTPPKNPSGHGERRAWNNWLDSDLRRRAMNGEIVIKNISVYSERDPCTEYETRKKSDNCAKFFSDIMEKNQFPDQNIKFYFCIQYRKYRPDGRTDSEELEEEIKKFRERESSRVTTQTSSDLEPTAIRENKEIDEEIELLSREPITSDLMEELSREIGGSEKELKVAKESLFSSTPQPKTTAFLSLDQFKKIVTDTLLGSSSMSPIKKDGIAEQIYKKLQEKKARGLSIERSVDESLEEILIINDDLNHFFKFKSKTLTPLIASFISKIKEEQKAATETTLTGPLGNLVPGSPQLSLPSIPTPPLTLTIPATTPLSLSPTVKDSSTPQSRTFMIVASNKDYLASLKQELEQQEGFKNVEIRSHKREPKWALMIKCQTEAEIQKAQAFQNRLHLSQSLSALAPSPLISTSFKPPLPQTFVPDLTSLAPRLPLSSLSPLLSSDGGIQKQLSPMQLNPSQTSPLLLSPDAQGTIAHKSTLTSTGQTTTQSTQRPRRKLKRQKPPDQDKSKKPPPGLKR